MKTIKKDLEVANIHLNIKEEKETIDILEIITKEREEWRTLIRVLMTCNESLRRVHQMMISFFIYLFLVFI